jgi:hypothetical protein
VQGHKKHPVIFPEHLLRAVAMMDLH